MRPAALTAPRAATRSGAITEQENMIGRRRATGYPLDSSAIHATPDFARDPSGAVIPLTAHIRLANPRMALSADSRILRRAYTYERGGYFLGRALLASL